MTEEDYLLAKKMEWDVMIVKVKNYGVEVTPHALGRNRKPRFTPRSANHNGSSTYTDRDGSIWAETPSAGFGRCSCPRMRRLYVIRTAAKRRNAKVNVSVKLEHSPEWHFAFGWPMPLMHVEIVESDGSTTTKVLE